MNDNTKTARRLKKSVAAIVILGVCLALTTAALVMEAVSVNGNLFQTGGVKIDLNGGKPIIEEHEFLFEPGMTVKKDFYIKNESTRDVYYKLYMTDISGGLSDVLQITIKSGTKTLYKGSAHDLTEENAVAAGNILRRTEKRNLQMIFYFPPAAGNAAQDKTLSFDLKASAVQVKNNPEKAFS